MIAVNWMPKYCKSKDRNPNDPDISISTQHTDGIGFSCTISQENIPINKYYNILKAQKLKRIMEDSMKIMRRNVQRMPKSQEKSTRKNTT
jgi:hypothetical protein